MANIFYNEHPLVVNPELAKIFGINEAIVLQQIHYWLTKNKNIRDGKNWVYNSVKDWAEQFPFWNERTVRRIFEKLISEGLIITGNYNQKAFDRTKWYSIDYEAIEKKIRAFTENGECIRTNCPNGSGQNVQMDVDNLSQPIPENTQRLTTENNKIHIEGDNQKEKKRSKNGNVEVLLKIDAYTDNEDLKNSLYEFLVMRTRIKKPLTEHAVDLALKRLSELADTDENKIKIVNQSVLHCWQSFYALKYDNSSQKSEKPKYEGNFYGD